MISSPPQHASPPAADMFHTTFSSPCLQEGGLGELTMRVSIHLPCVERRRSNSRVDDRLEQFDRNRILPSRSSADRKLELHLLPFCESGITSALDFADVNESVTATFNGKESGSPCRLARICTYQ